MTIAMNRSHSIRACCAVAVFGCVLAATAVHCEDANDPLRQARQLLDEKKPADALKVLAAVLERNPRSVQAYILRAEAQRKLGNSKAAWSDADKAVELDPKEPLAWEIRGLLWTDTGDWAKAEAEFDRGVKLAPAQGSLWFFRGVTRFRQNNIAGAIADYGRAVEILPEDYGVWTARADAHRAAGRLDLAIPDYTKAVRLNSSDPARWVSRGQAYLESGEPKRAAADFSAAIRLDRNVADYWQVRCEAYLAIGDWEYACRDAGRATELDPKLAPAWNFLGIASLRLRRWDAARAAYAKAIELAPNVAIYRRNVAALAVDREDWAAAAEGYAACLKLEDATLNNFFEATLLAAYKGRGADATAFFRQAYERFGDSPNSANLLTLAYLSALLPEPPARLPVLRDHVAQYRPGDREREDADLVAGLLELRAGDATVAVARLKRVVWPSQPDKGWHAVGELTLAVAQFRRTPGDQTRHAAEAALAKQPEAIPEAKDGYRFTWQHRFGNELIRRCAAGVFASTDTQPSKQP